MGDNNPFFAFDWYFTDAAYGDSARSQALEARPSETVDLQCLISADSIVHFALWEELPRKHPIGELWLETETDLKASIYLAYGGFFRQALTVLRAWFEIAVHGVYYSAHYGQPTGRYEQWRKGEKHAPANMRKLADSLASRDDKLISVDKKDIFDKLDPIYTFLSCQTHAQGLDKYNLDC